MSTTPANDSRTKRGSPYLWPAIVIGALAIHALVMTVTVVIATSDRSFAVEPDYYQKAVHWEDAQRQSATNETLGWRLTWEIGEARRGDGERQIRCTLANRTETMLDGAQVEVEVFSHVRAQERHKLPLRGGGNGVYFAQFPFDIAGTWEFRALVKRGPDVFTSTQRVDIKP